MRSVFSHYIHKLDSYDGMPENQTEEPKQKCKCCSIDFKQIFEEAFK